MKKIFNQPINNKLASIFLAVLLCISFSDAKAQYTINNVFGNTTECDTMTRGIYIVWWDNDFDFSSQADVLLDSMMSYRNTCLTELSMMDPPNPIDGHYYNVYLHVPGNTNDIFNQYNWGNGQGTDNNGYPYLTLPQGVLTNWMNNAHETFHIFQYNSNSPGFGYNGNSQWYIEASANWFAAKENPGAPRAFIEAESLVRVPHVPLWLSYENFPNSYSPNWQRYVHQYALAMLLYYITEETDATQDLITSGLYSGTTEYPQEYFYNQLGGEVFRNHFIDYAAHMCNDFDFITSIQANNNEQEWQNYAELSDDNEYTETYTNTGSNGWYRPIDEEITNAWSFNTFKLENDISETYTFQLNGDSLGSYGDPAYFKAKVVVRNYNSGTTFHDLIMANDLEGSLTLTLSPDDYEVYFIIASMPEIFGDDNANFQLFPYDMRILTGPIAGINDLELSNNKVEVARYNQLGQKIDESASGIQIILFSDGSTKKVINSNQ